jgi:ribosome-associated protein
MQINPNLFGISLDLLYLCAQIIYNLLMKELVETIKEAIQEKKGSNIVVADLTKIEGTICQYFMICTGNSPTQVEAIAESVGDMVREKLGEKPAHVVGLENAQWVAMDYTDVLVHIFLPDVREYYDLEHLWEDAPIEQIPDLD